MGPMGLVMAHHGALEGILAGRTKSPAHPSMSHG